LRAQIASLEAASRPVGRLLLGDEGVDQALPGGGLDLGALHAVAPAAHLDQPAAAGFLLGLGARALTLRPGVLALVSAPGGLDFGAPYAPGLAGWGVAGARVLQVRARSVKDALWAAEEALRSAGAAAVALTLGAAGAAVTPASARRLQLAAEAGGGVGLVLGAIGVARSRWTIAAAPSAAPAWASGQGLPAILVAPGAARFCARVRASDGRERAFSLEWRHETGGFHHVAGLADAALAAGPWRAAG
jgi:protein ImuA